ncbi:HypC/HybG/HupF family hydrogenase formation chaperone [Raoultibacter phocaeensis]|uniref:HypC/HybG/HupF family hydrogenase formation chaperone n=1 Tax=Raoultibacter phocaeensis TaxID=2479841 RepID=UPI0011194B6C|nr:HypC/HybG/HupF family hydrogenase formation chaperone [Raoultibacter phocaeensis]
MCLAIPAKITELKDDHMATVDILGVTRDISLDLTPQAVVDNYVLVHAGFAIEVVDEQFAQETIDLIKEFPELAMDDVPQGEETRQTPAGASASLGSLGL